MSSVVPQNHRADAAGDVSLGTASWMLPDEARSRFEFNDRLFELDASGLWHGSSDGQIWLGEAVDSAAGALGYVDDRHICLVSGTRGGKGTGVIIPNLCLWPGSCIVIDPKGENATVTALRRGKGSEYSFGLGQTVRILDPFSEVQLDASLKARYNPLDAIDPASDYAVDDAGRVAGALVVAENRNDPYWEEAARDLIKSLILHVLTDPDFDGRRNLVSVWRLLNQGDWISLEILRSTGEKNIPSGFDLLWQGMKRSPAYNGLVAGTGEQYAGMAERTRSSILGSARGSLEFISGPPMQRLLEASDFDLAGLKTDPKGLTLYLTLPQRYMSTHFRWLRLMVSLAVGEMERIRGRPKTGYPTLFVLDEFAGLKRMEVIEHAAAQAAGFGAKFLFVVQNLTQLKENYKDSWETFLGNSGLKFFFQIEDDFTRSYITRQLGEHEVRRSTRSGSQSQSTSSSITEGSSQSSTVGTSSSLTDGKSGGSSTGRTRGSSSGSSRNYEGPFGMFKTGEGDNDGSNKSTTRTSNKGWSSSVSSSRSRSQSTSTSSSQSRSMSESITDGWSEGVHKRSLLNPDEVGRLLARVDDTRDPAYPGIILAQIPGRHPLLVRRVNYFESPKFAGFFDPHPDFPPPPTLAELARIAASRKAAETPIEPIEYRPEQSQFWQKKKSKELSSIITVGVPILAAIIIVVLGVVVLPQYDNNPSNWSGRTSQATSSSGPDLLEPNAGYLDTVAISPDGRVLASGTVKGAIDLWDPVSGNRLHRMKASRQSNSDNQWFDTNVLTLSFSSDGMWLAANDTRQNVKVWDMDGHGVRTIATGIHDIRQLAFVPGTKTFAVTGDALEFWDAASGKQLRVYHTDGTTIESVAFSQSGRYFAAGHGNGEIRIWDMQKWGYPISRFSGHNRFVLDMAFSPDEQSIASGGYDHTVHISDVASGRLLHVLSGFSDQVLGVRFSPDGKILATSSNDGRISLWDVTSFRELRRFKHDDAAALAFSPDGKRIASAGGDGVRIFNVFGPPDGK